MVKRSTGATQSANGGHPNLGVLLLRTRRRLHNQVTEFVHRAGFSDLRPAHDAVFAFLPDGGARLTALAHRARITKQSMGEVVRELEGLGYVEQVTDPSDRRAKVVRLTVQGQAANNVALAAFRAVEEAWGGEIGVRKTEQLRQVLEQLAWGR